jgi:predicted permease
MGSRRNDAKQAFRIFFRNPAFAAVAVIVLAVGIGAATAIFTVFSALMLRPLALPHPEQLVELSGVYRNHGRIVLSYPMFSQLERQQHAFSAIAGWSGSTGANVEVNGTLAPAEVRSVTGNYYTVTEERPELGRLLTESDRQGTSAVPVAVISHPFWQRRFGKDPAIVGKSLRIEGKLFTIVGVARPWSTGITVGDAPDLTVPTGALENYDLSSRALLWLNVTGRLQPGVSLEQARSQIGSFWPRLLEDTVPTQSVGPRRQAFLSMGFRLDPAQTGVNTGLREKVQKPLYLLLAMVALILLLVCINLASLTLARASARRHEVTTRIALGATPWQAVRQSVMESVLLAATGAVWGLALAYWGSHVLVSLMTSGEAFPILLDLRPDWRVLCFSVSCAIMTGLFIGIVPAWKLSRESSAQLQPSRRTLSHGVGLLGKALIVSQITISLVLLQGAGLFLRSLEALRSFNPGFERKSLTEVEFAEQPQALNQPLSPEYRRELVQAVANLPGVESAAFSSLPIPANNNGWTETVSSTTDSNTANTVSATLDSVSPGFFHTLAIPYVAGRDFNWNDDATHPRVVVIDSLLALQLFPHTNPIGQHLRFGVQPEFQSLEIVGVAQSARLIDVHDGNAAVLYVPEAQNSNYNALLIRKRAGVQLDKSVADEFLSFGREYVVATHTYDQKSDEALVFEQMTARLSSFFAAVALLVAAAGLFGLMSYAVTLRTREIGIRMALGSQRAAILRLIVREATVLTLIGIAIGIPAALIAGRFVAHMLFELSSADPLTLVSASATILLAGLLAGYLPARSAMKLDPVVALRQDG